jgi:acyl-coenzyme A thioesterase PaaI-like protein
MSLIDNVSGWAATTLLGPLVTTSITVHFHRPVTGEVAALGVVLPRTHRAAVVTATIRGASGDLSETGRASFVAIDEPVEESPSASTNDVRSRPGPR